MAIIINGSTGISGVDGTSSTPAVVGSGTNTGIFFSAGQVSASLAGTSANIALVSGTAQNSTSGTSIDFTGIPSWVKRITVICDGVSTTGTSLVQLQVGTSSGIVTSGYTGTYGNLFANNSVQVSNATNGLVFGSGGSAAEARVGHCILTQLTGNTWVMSSTMGNTVNSTINWSGSQIGRAHV